MYCIGLPPSKQSVWIEDDQFFSGNRSYLYQFKVEAKCLENLCLHAKWIMAFPDDEDNGFPKVGMQIDASDHKKVLW